MDSFKTKAGTELPLLNLKGKSYLEVSRRIQWFREEHPMGLLETECVESNEKYVLYRATVSIWHDNRHVKVSDSIKREDYSHFPDAHEKASTGAIGRALALLGYGTQFALDLEEGERIVDSPVPSKPALKALPNFVENQEEDLGAYVMSMGKEFKGKRLDECDMYKLANFSKWLSEQEKLDARGKETVAAIEAFLHSREFDRARKS